MFANGCVRERAIHNSRCHSSRNLYKSHKVLSVSNTANAGNPVPQEETDALWLKRRVGGASIPTLRNTGVGSAAYDADRVEEDKAAIAGQWSFVLGIMIAVTFVAYLWNQWTRLLTKRHTRRKRAVGRIRRVIQAIAMRRVPQM